MTQSVRSARILVIGHSCLDSISVCRGTPPADGKLVADRICIGVGGPAANAAIALTRLGHRVRLLTRYGADPAGEMIDRALRTEGIDLPLSPDDTGTSSLAQIRATGAQRSVVWRRGKLPPIPSDSDVMEDWLAECDVLYVDGHEVAASTVALQIARQRGVVTVADPGSLRAGAEPWPQWLDSVVATPRWLAARYPEASSLSQAVELLSGDASGDALCGVTLGESGGLALRDGIRYPWRARKTGAVDTTAAGDAFHAGLADGLVQGMETQAALDWAATLAAAVCRAPGNVALPRDREELTLWHGRWGHRPEMSADALDRNPSAV